MGEYEDRKMIMALMEKILAELQELNKNLTFTPYVRYTSEQLKDFPQSDQPLPRTEYGYDLPTTKLPNWPAKWEGIDPFTVCSD